MMKWMLFKVLSLLYVQKVDAHKTQARSRLQPFNEPCLAVLVDVLRKKDDPKRKKEEDIYLKCMLPNDHSYRIKSADYAFVMDNFFKGPFRSSHTLMTLPDAMLDLDKLEIILPDGQKPILSDMKDEQYDMFRRKRRLATTTGTFTIMVVRVNTSNHSPSYTEGQFSDAVFGTSGDTVTLTSQYKDCSHDQLLFQPVTGTGITDGAITVSVASASSAGDETVVDEAITALTTALGSNPSSIADYVMFCLPQEVMNGAYAYIDSWSSVYEDFECTYLSTQMHELGHNMNLGHSGEGNDEYADQSGMMGYSYSNTNGPLMCFNAAKMWQLGWFSSRAIELDVSGTNSYSGNLADMTQNPAISGDPIVIKLNTPTDEDYFLSFNRATGFNSGTQEGANEVRIVEKESTTITNYFESYVYASLASGETWTSGADFSGQRATVTVNSIGTVANVDICIGTCASPTKSPSPSTLPSTSPSVSPSILSLAPSNAATISALPTRVPSEEPSKEPSQTNALPTATPTVAPIAPTATPTVAPITPTATPTIAPIAPTAAPTPWASTCVDYGGRFRFRRVDSNRSMVRSCNWVARTNTATRCAYIGVSAVCPVTCNTCLACEDPDSSLRFKFEKDGVTLTKSCDWVKRRQFKVRCKQTNDVCRLFCGACGRL